MRLPSLVFVGLLGVCLVLKALDDVQGWMNDRVSYLIYLLLFFWYLT